MQMDLSGRHVRRFDVEVIDMAVNVDHVHLFIKYPPKYSVSFNTNNFTGEAMLRHPLVIPG